MVTMEDELQQGIGSMNTTDSITSVICWLCSYPLASQRVRRRLYACSCGFTFICLDSQIAHLHQFRRWPNLHVPHKRRIHRIAINEMSTYAIFMPPNATPFHSSIMDIDDDLCYECPRGPGIAYHFG